jgi:TolB-like protein
MSLRSARSRGNRELQQREAGTLRKIPARTLNRRVDKPHFFPPANGVHPQWPCLLSSLAVGVGPFRNLTGDADQQLLVEALTDDLVSNLHWQGRGFLLQRVAVELETLVKSAGGSDVDVRYVVSGSAQCSSPGMLRVNVRITDAESSEYLWARRYEFRTEEAASIRGKITRRISRELHVLLLQNEIRRAFLAFEAEPDPNECLATAAVSLEGELRAEITAEAQRWFLAALGGDPRNVEALVGLARTCQELVSNPWWSDPVTVAIASDLGREVIAIALELAPGHADAHCVQGMLYSAAGELDKAARAFERALVMDHELAIAHGFAGYNAAFLGSASRTLPAINRAMRLDRADRRHSIWCFFGGFSELLLGRIEQSIALLRKSLERNSSYGSARLFLMAALSLSGRRNEAIEAASSFRQQYPDCPTGAFEQLWLSRSASAVYCAQISPLLERIRDLGVPV